VTDFLAKAPTLDTNWRAIACRPQRCLLQIALAKTLLGIADCGADRVPLEDTAAPYAGIWLSTARVDGKRRHRQASFDACRAFNRGRFSDKLAGLRFGNFNNVIDAFHVVGGARCRSVFCRRA
jgi:hypothetical protein